MLRVSDRPITVLFADDKRDILDMLRVAAELRGWQVETAATAEDMIAKINARCSAGGPCFDAVVGDMRYESERPGVLLMDGLSALREIRKQFRDLPFIFLTAYIEPRAVRMMKELGAGYEQKGVDLDQFLNRIESVVRQTRAAYRGPERRSRGINSSGQYRRQSDAAHLRVPPALEAANGRANRARAGVAGEEGQG